MDEEGARAALRPEASQVLAELRAPFTEMRRALESAMPAMQVAHSLHYELLRQPQIARNPAMRRFTHLELWELHTEISLAGLLQRALRGETTPAVLLSIGEHIALLASVVPRAQEAWRMFRRSPEAALLPREVSELDRHLAEVGRAGEQLQAQALRVRSQLQTLTGVPWIIPAAVAATIRGV